MTPISSPRPETHETRCHCLSFNNQHHLLVNAEPVSARSQNDNFLTKSQPPKNRHKSCEIHKADPNDVLACGILSLGSRAIVDHVWRRLGHPNPTGRSQTAIEKPSGVQHSISSFTVNTTPTWKTSSEHGFERRPVERIDRTSVHVAEPMKACFQWHPSTQVSVLKRFSQTRHRASKAPSLFLRTPSGAIHDRERRLTTIEPVCKAP